MESHITVRGSEFSAIAPDVASLISGLLPWLALTPSGVVPPVRRAAPPPNSPVFHVFWKQHSSLFEFLLVSLPSFTTDDESAPAFPLSAFGGTNVPSGTYSINAKSLDYFDEKLDKWIVILKIARRAADDFPRLSVDDLFFELIK